MKTSQPKLSILIATIGRRNDQFITLAEELTRQAEGLPVEIIAYWNNGEYPIGNIREALMQAARGEYTCFIDDDDWIPAWYIAEILANLGKDYIGFQVELFEQGKQMKPVYHSIRYGIWHQDENGYYRGITHLNPIKRELALTSHFTLSGAGEDEYWSINLTPRIRTENYINKIMYYYRHDVENSIFSGSRHDVQEYTRPQFKHPQFKWHRKSKLRGQM